LNQTTENELTFDYDSLFVSHKVYNTFLNNTKCFCLYLPRGRFWNRSFASRTWNESQGLFCSVFLFQWMTDSRYNSGIRKIVTTRKYMKQDTRCNYKRHNEAILF